MIRLKFVLQEGNEFTDMRQQASLLALLCLNKLHIYLIRRKLTIGFVDLLLIGKNSTILP